MLEALIVAGVAGIALLSLFFRNFHRDPDRTPPDGPHILAPADGVVIDLMDLPPGEDLDMPKGILGRVRALTDDLGDGPHVMIPIFMNPFNVHVQWGPIDGTVLRKERRAGGFIRAFSLEALENATVETLIETEIGKVKILQTAGFLVRHIHNWLEPGQAMRKGQRFGKIDFGSQVTIILPKKDCIEIRARKGDRVFAGETILATITERAE